MKSLTNICWLLGLFILCSNSLKSQDHLEPVSNGFGMDNWKREYYGELAELFFEYSGDQFQLMTFVVLPSFENESGFRLLRNNDSQVYTLEFFGAKSSVWNEGFKENPGKIRVKRVTHDINEELATLIMDLNNAAISTIKVPSPDLKGFDGVSYFFSNISYTGKTWSPKEGRIKDLIIIFDRLLKKSKVTSSEFSLEEKEIDRILSLTKTLTNN